MLIRANFQCTRPAILSASLCAFLACDLHGYAIEKYMKKILFIHDYPPFNGGGLAINVLDLTSFLSKKYQCKIITSRLKDHFADDNGYAKQSILIYKKNWFYLLCIFIKEILKSDILIINFTFSFRIFSILSLLINFIPKKKSILVIHTELKHLNFNRFKKFPTFIKNTLVLFLKFISLNCDKLVVFNNNQHLRLNKIGFKNVIKLPMFVCDCIEYQNNFNFSMNYIKEKHIYYIGELSRLKCFDRFLIEIESNNLSYPAVIIGNGELKKRVKNIKSKTAQIKTYDAVSHKEIKNFLKKAYSLYFPSINDSWGRIIIESMLSGVLIITSEIPLLEDMSKESYINIDQFRNLNDAMAYISSEINVNKILKTARLEALRCNDIYKNNWEKAINSI